MSLSANDLAVLQSLLSPIAEQLQRLNDNLESGRINIRTHAPLCVAPPKAEWTLSQMEAAGKFLAHAIETGAFVLPLKGEGNVAPEKSGGDS